MHVDNWPNGIQPKRTEGETEGPGPGRGGNGSGEVVWPEAADRTGAVSRTERDHGGGVSGRTGTSGSAGLGVLRQPAAPGAVPGVDPAPWEQPGRPGRNHDPHEVTVQLDGVGREVDEGQGRHAGRAADAAGAGQDSDGPVFVDESGRRRNLYRRLGIAVGTACAAYAVVIVGTLVSGNSDAPWLPVPMQKDDKPAGKVDTPPLPAESDDRSDEAEGFVPDAGPGGGRTGATSSPGAKSPAGASGKAKQPATSGSAEPSAGPSPKATPKPQPKPSGGAKDPEPSAPAPEPPKVDPSPAEPPPASPTPSETGTPDPGPGSGTDTVADGPASPAPVEPAPSAPQDSQSPQEPASPQDPQNPESPA
ncbi:hypothetical protein PV332_19710 [Streptomyces scabiei]|uniref:hypothetical protein n=6 Tax=Streptomyces scabiei TaxID=1930 RepID=UPI001E3DA881|nr:MULTISPECIES: hypothetical protein [Streptomyces]MDW8473386.1 hypothetical protein [Streptomyces scabiei]MDX2577681.1 hypothetical protein [Streptomyces scabiei]MDX2868770.1 hypothetical protein [Streptomyces scabiei]MDX3031721.1 hypothetical protein [Streptomyces scabiei]MDX3147174.1 hypothetical protein [Streptomyces scabiei]